MEEVGIAEVGIAEVGRAEFGMEEVGIAEVGRAEVGRAEVGRAEVGRAEVGRAEVGIAEVGIAEVGRAEVGRAEVVRAEVGIAEVGIFTYCQFNRYLPTRNIALEKNASVIPILYFKFHAGSQVMTCLRVMPIISPHKKDHIEYPYLYFFPCENRPARLSIGAFLCRFFDLLKRYDLDGVRFYQAFQTQREIIF